MKAMSCGSTRSDGMSKRLRSAPRQDPHIANPAGHPNSSLEEAIAKLDRLTRLQIRGYQVAPGKTPAEDRVMIDGGYYRVDAAIEHGLLPNF